ncbi:MULTISPECIES: MATE family efflux transporter [Comamonas]|uniref:MATE family efflux transporter n=1 Tax=Comamonas TaxID=283 RepID=UPI00050DD54D|nr:MULTISPECIES: MATE family efflux transporter [Comamonas]KGG83891.1 multidrug transporter MatE [Comamonas thiooxydans]KGG94102.1 multidrug transporter MatE [Comamonas thiooxydans]KGH01711.1 multidrug transporter MatE [Comamonas thiooxydans]KGH04738.1 multidrug transporter MatE [Comamonas thiooxydans]TZG08990.1 MATE family efflux transporter [Comamonas thiooxydans]
MKGELQYIGRHAGTVLAGQLAVMAFGTTDTIVASRYSNDAVAAHSVGSAIFISVYASLMGIFQALLPLWSEQRGAGQPLAIGQSLRQSMYLCAMACVLGMAVLLMPGALLHWTGVPDVLQLEVKRYLAVLAWGLPPALLFRIYSALNQALGHPKLVTWLQLISLLIKIPLSIWFTFGGLGLAPLGAVGCALATLLVNYTMFAVALWLMRTQDFYAPLALWQKLERPDWRQLGHFCRLGVPAGLAILVEVTSFTLMALYVARQGSLSSASHQIAANLAAICYMVPLSLAIATSARVSYWRGAGDEAQARTLIQQCFKLALLIGIATAATLLITRTWIADIYTDSPRVLAMTSWLLICVAAYHVADCVQTYCIFVLRCYRVTVAPLVIYCLLLWGGGLGLGYWLTYRWQAAEGWLDWQATPMPFWVCSAAALFVTAMAFSSILHRAIRPPKPQAQPRAS